MIDLGPVVRTLEYKLASSGKKIIRLERGGYLWSFEVECLKCKRVLSTPSICERLETVCEVAAPQGLLREMLWWQ